ncbi:MAG TPA: hypothetical protein VEY33_07820 [Gemmatimonadota bacterium]|nr:hypothetical protein [Gemmatimonadota bacterium]
MWLSAGGWLATLALGILVAPLVADAQRPAKVWRIGLFHVDYVPLGFSPFPANAMD